MSGVQRIEAQYLQAAAAQASSYYQAIWQKMGFILDSIWRDRRILCASRHFLQFRSYGHGTVFQLGSHLGHRP